MSFFLFFFFFLYCFDFGFGLCCFIELEDWEGMGWKVGRVRGWKVGRVRGWQGEVVYYWQNGGGVAIWRKRERSNSQQIKQTRKNT